VTSAAARLGEGRVTRLESILSRRLPRTTALVVGLAVALVVPLAQSPFWSFVAALTALYVVFGLSVVVLTGLSGQISLMQFTYVGVGAFAAYVAGERNGLPLPVAVVIAGLATVPVSVLVGVPALRLRGMYLAIATLTVADVFVRQVFASRAVLGTASTTGALMTRPSVIESDRALYIAAFALACFASWTVAGLRKGRLGRAFLAVRENDDAATALGVNVVKYRILAFVLAGLYPGVGGALYAYLIGGIAPLQFGFTQSLQLLFGVIVGGLFSVTGAVVAALLAVLQVELFKGRVGLVTMVGLLQLGVLLVVMMRKPGGLVQIAQDAVAWARLSPTRRWPVVVGAVVGVVVTLLLAYHRQDMAARVLGVVLAATAVVLYRLRRRLFWSAA